MNSSGVHIFEMRSLLLCILHWPSCKFVAKLNSLHCISLNIHLNNIMFMLCIMFQFEKIHKILISYSLRGCCMQPIRNYN